jgi:oligopeptide/dipeptide ABC transporter ATP-binding protein
MSPQRPHDAEGVVSARSPLLEVENLTTHYPIPRGIVGAISGRPKQVAHAVDGVSFFLARGEMLALVGESGCGKTTTAQTVMRLVDPVGGTIRFCGDDITHLRHRDLRPLRRRMQLIYQDPYDALDPRFRVRQAVEEPLLVHHLGSRTERTERVERALERAGLAPADLFLDRYPHELSGGQRQRVAIATALVLEPELLVADEPVSMLDVSVRAEILTLLDELRRSGLGILMITHDLSTAARFADRIAVMYLGRIVEQGAAQDVVRDPRHPYTRALITVVPKRDPRDRTTPQILKGEAPNPVKVPSGCRFHPRCPEVASGRARDRGLEERCRSDDPLLREISRDHLAACHLA